MKGQHPSVGKKTRDEHISQLAGTSQHQNLIESMAREEARIIRRRAYQRAYQHQRCAYQRAYQRQRRARLKSAGGKELQLCSTKGTITMDPTASEVTLVGHISLSTQNSELQNLIVTVPREDELICHNIGERIPNDDISASIVTSQDQNCIEMAMKGEDISLSSTISRHENIAETIQIEANPSSLKPFADAPPLIQEGIQSSMKHVLKVLESTPFESFGERLNFFQAHLAWFKRYSVPVSDFEDRFNQLLSLYSESRTRHEEIKTRLQAIAQAKAELDREEGALVRELNCMSSRFSACAK